MNNYYISCCSTVDLTPGRMKARDLRYVCFKFMLDGVEYPDDMGVTMSSEELFRRMENGADTKTSQVSAMEYAEHFEAMLKEGKISFTSRCLRESAEPTIPLGWRKRSWHRNIPSARSILWILWAPPAATVCWWTRWPICVTRGRRLMSFMNGPRRTDCVCITGFSPRI